MRTPQSHLSASDLKNQLPNVSQIARDLFSIEFKHNVAKCPLATNHNHGDRDPSLRYDRRKNRIFCASQQCFGEKGADAFGLVQKLENCSFQEAHANLSKRYGLLSTAKSSLLGASPRAVQIPKPGDNAATSLAERVRERLKRDGFEVKAEYFYSPLLRKVRFEHASELQPGKQKPRKEFRWEHCINGIWHSGDGGLTKPLYANRQFRETERLALVFGFEGEGKADAAAQLGIAAFSFKDITPTQARELVGCTVVIWPDNDASGLKQCSAASEVIAACGQVGEVKELTPPDDFPASADIVDVIAELGWDREKILEFVDTARLVEFAESGQSPRTETSMSSVNRTPWTNESPFRVSTEGVFFVKPSEDGSNTPVWLSAPVHVIAQTRDSNGSNWGRLLQWRDNEGREHEWVMPMELLASDATAVRARLLSDGLPSITTNARLRERFIEYLQTAPERCLRTTSKIGWHGGEFVLPDQVFAPNNREEIRYQGSAESFEDWGVHGSLEDWRDHIGIACSGNSRLILAVSAAFAGPVLGLTKSESGGIHLFGPSSTGKTTALVVGSTVCGGGANGRVRTWRATTNGLEAVACSHNDSTLFIDEISQVDPTQVSETAYLLANGRGKLRMTKTISSHRALSWTLLFVSAGEITLADHAASVGRSTKAGVGVRLLNIPADAGRGMGLFEELHGARSPQAFVLALRDAASKFYGTPFRAFLARLVADQPSVGASLNGAQTKVNEMIPASATGQVRRAAERLSLIAAAGELATGWGITGWKEGEATWAVKECLLAWIQSRGTTGDSDAEIGVRRVRAFLETHGQSRFPLVNQLSGPLTNESLIRDRAGFRRRAEDPSVTDYLIFRETFRKEICGGLDYQVVAKELKNRGFLLCDPTGYTVKPRLPGIGSIRVFCVLASILESDEC